MFKSLYFWLVCALLPITVGVRTWQLTYSVDADGFYLPEHQSIGTVLGLICLGVVAVLLVAGRYLLKQQVPTVAPQKRYAVGVAAMVLALCCVVQTAILAGQTTSMIQLLPCLATMIGFTLIGAFHLQRKTLPFGVTVIPVLSEFVRLVLNYANFNGLVKVSAQIVEILLLCSFLLFCMGLCRGYSGIQSARGLAWCMGAGSGVAVFGAMASLPPMIAKGTLTSFGIFAFGTAVFALTFMATLTFGKSNEAPACEIRETNAEIPIEEEPEPIADDGQIELVHEEQPAPSQEDIESFEEE